MELPLQEKSYRRFLNPLLVAASAAVIFLMYDRWGNTTETASYGVSAWGWMTSLWKSARIYGGTAFAFGWLIPLLSLLLIWRERATLRTLPARASGIGFALVLLALLLHWMGLRAQQTRLSLLALVLLIWAIVFYLHGWPRAKHTLFACGLLVFCVPLNFLDVLTFPMQRLAAALAGVLLAGLGIPILRKGSLIQPEAMAPTDALPLPFDGADAAGGLGVLLILLILSAFWGAWLRRTAVQRCILLLLTPLLHIAANSLRLVVVTLLQTMAGSEVSQAVNTRAATALVFAFSLALLLALDKVLRSWKNPRQWQLLQPTPPSIG